MYGHFRIAKANFILMLARVLIKLMLGCNLVCIVNPPAAGRGAHPMFLSGRYSTWTDFYYILLYGTDWL